MLKNLVVVALLFCVPSFATPREEWEKVVGIVMELAVSDGAIAPDIVERIDALRRDETACAEIRDFWKTAEPLELASLARPLATLFRRAADNEPLAAAYVQAGFVDLLNELEMRFNSRAPADVLEPWMLVPPEAQQLQGSMANLSARLTRMKNTLTRIKVRFFMYQSALSVTSLWWFAEKFPQYVPSSYFLDWSKTAVVVSISGLVLGKNIALFRAWWPSFNLRLGKTLAGRRYRAVVDAISEAVRVSPEEMVAPLVELGKVKELRARILEDATIEAFIENLDIPQVREALAGLALQSVEEGELARATRILDTLIKKSPPGDPVVELARQLESAMKSRSVLEDKLKSIRKAYVAKNIAITGLIGAAGFATLHHYYPDFIGTLKAIGVQLVGLFGVSRLARYLWFTHPTDRLRARVKDEIASLQRDFEDLLSTDPAHTLPIVLSVAVPDNHTHAFVREAAVLAMEQSSDPRVAQGFRQLALMNVQRRGTSEDTEEMLRRYFAGYGRCIQGIRATLLARQAAHSEGPFVDESSSAGEQPK